MKISEAEMIEIVPDFIKENNTTEGLCAAADIIIKKISETSKLINLFRNLQIISTDDLDFIAKSENIPWYDTAYTRQQKEKIIENYEKNCMILGTKASVKNVTSEIFGENTIKEWDEYGGAPKHYKVLTEFVGDIEKAAADYEKRIRQVKSFRSALDDLTFNQEIKLKNLAGAAFWAREKIIIKEGGSDGRV